MIAAMRKAVTARPKPMLGVWRENWTALRVFLGMATQWRRAGMAGVPVGLDYSALPAIAGALEIPVNADLLARLRVMEGEALIHLGRRK